MAEDIIELCKSNVIIKNDITDTAFFAILDTITLLDNEMFVRLTKGLLVGCAVRAAYVNGIIRQNLSMEYKTHCMNEVIDALKEWINDVEPLGPI